MIAWNCLRARQTPLGFNASRQAQETMVLEQQGADMSSRETCSIEQNASGNLGWTKVCSEFADANIYQTWPYEVVQSGESNVSGVAFRKDSTIFGAAQARILRLPLLGIGIAYVLGGPLWRSKNATINLDAFRQNIRALRSEYVGRRKHCLRINPQ